MVKIIDASKDLEIMNYLKEHTYVQTQSFFNISAQQVARVKKRNIINDSEAQPEPTPQPPVPQPEPEIPAVGSRTAAVDEIDEIVPISQKKDRIAEILSTKKPKDQKNRKQATDWYMKGLIIKSQEKYYQQFDKNIKISF